MLLFVDQLTNIDFSYLDGDRGLVGETWLASIALDGALDEQGMVCDFGIVKKTVRNWLDEHIDHCLVVAEKSPCLSYDIRQGATELSWLYGDKQLHCTSPQSAITFVDTDTISPETVADWCVTQLRKELPETIGEITLTFIPEAIAGDYYHYSHGLKTVSYTHLTLPTIA